MRAATFWLMALSSHKRTRIGIRSASNCSGLGRRGRAGRGFGAEQGAFVSTSQSCAGLTGLVNGVREHQVRLVGRFGVLAHAARAAPAASWRRRAICEFPRPGPRRPCRAFANQECRNQKFRRCGAGRAPACGFPTLREIIPHLAVCSTSTAAAGRVVIHNQNPQVGEPGLAACRARTARRSVQPGHSR